MPISALGRYDAVVPGMVGGRPVTIVATPFTYVPTFRFVVVALIVAGAWVARRRPWRAVDLRRASWLLVPMAVGVGLCTIGSRSGHGMWDIIVWFVGAQVSGAAAALFVVGWFRNRQRIVGAITVYVAVAALTLALGTVAGDGSGIGRLVAQQIGMVLVVAAAWVLPSTVGLVSVRRHWGALRLAAGVVGSWLLAIAAVVAVVFCTAGPRGLNEPSAFLLMGLFFGGPYVVAYWLLLCLHRWSRQAVGRTFGVSGLQVLEVGTGSAPGGRPPAATEASAVPPATPAPPATPGPGPKPPDAHA